MCGADHGPDHDDPVASSVCDLYHRFSRADLPRLEQVFDAREKELLWQVALGVGPDGLARRLGSSPAAVRADLGALEGRLREFVSERSERTRNTVSPRSAGQPPKAAHR